MTYEEFQAELVKTPELMDSIYENRGDDFTKHLTDKKGMVVTTVTEIAKDREKLIGDTTKKNHTDWEKKLEGIVGAPRPDGVNGLTWLDQLIEKKELIKASKSGSDSNADTAAKDQAISDLQEQINTLTQNLETEKKGTFKAKVSAEINSGIGSLKFRTPSDIKDNDQKAAYQRDQVSANKALFNSLYTSEAMSDGKTLYKDGKGVAQVDSNGDPLSVEGIFSKNHSHLLVPAGKSQGGTGSGDENPNKEKPGYLGANTEEIRAAIAEKGVVKGSDEWQKLYEDAHKAAGYVQKDYVWTKS